MLIDTNIVSYIYKGDSRAEAYEARLTGQTLFVSFMTVAELYRWPFAKNWGESRKQGLVQFLKNFAVLPYDEGLAWSWAELFGKTCRGRPMSLGGLMDRRRCLAPRHAAGDAQQKALRACARTHPHYRKLRHA
jgi:tRNA(fMet)-specific endonuclease VapC